MVLAVQRWLRANTVYDLDVPRDPPGADAVDEFLFERRRGFCEHIASAMAVLLRSVGIPTRFVTGFGPGQRNAFTGYFQVRESDAHAWVEVLYPGIGWVPYDPTFGVPAADAGAAWFVAPNALRALGRWASHAIPSPVRAGAAATARAVAAGARGAFDAWPIALGIVTLIATAPWVLRRRRRTHGPPLRGAAAAFDRMDRALAARGRTRSPAQTPREYLRSIGRTDPVVVADAERIVRAFERERFAPGVLPERELDEAVAAAARIERALRPRVR
jgi:hypothetical protein